MKITLDNSEGLRIDLAISKGLNISREYAQKLIKEEQVHENGKIVLKPSYRVRGSIVVTMEEKELNLEKQNIPLDILYEDRDISVIDKQAGLLVHPTKKEVSNTLVNAILYHMELGSINGTIRPGIVHRLDRETSGLMVIAKNDIAHKHLSEQFKDRSVGKRYYAVVENVPLVASGRIENNISKGKTKMIVSKYGKEAISEYVLLKSNGKESLLDVCIKTGRTHQIRLHLAHIGLPVVGDALYGKKAHRHLLHCYSLSFKHPVTNELVSFKTDMPEEFKNRFEDWS